jgi:hypothetical protein
VELVEQVAVRAVQVKPSKPAALAKTAARAKSSAVSSSCAMVAGSPTTWPSQLIPDGEIMGESGYGPAPGSRCAPMCHSCEKINPPTACTPSVTFRQAASASSPNSRGTLSKPPADSLT